MKDEPITLLGGEGSAFIRTNSPGVLLGVMPWNFPYYQVARFAGPNLMIGNTIILKHARSARSRPLRSSRSSATPATHRARTRTSTPTTTRWRSSSPTRGSRGSPHRIGGSRRRRCRGRRPHLKKVVLELGGSDPFILLSTDDMDATVESAVAARLDNSGQSCNAAKRFIVLDELFDEFREKFTAAILAARPATRPWKVTTTAHSRPSKRLSTSSSRSSVRSTRAPRPRRGERSGAFFPATVLTDVARDNAARHEEFFGPVATLPRQSRTRRSSSPTTPRSASAPTCSPPTRSRRSASPTASKPGWSTSTWSVPTAPSCPSVESSAAAWAESSAATASKSSSTRS